MNEESTTPAKKEADPFDRHRLEAISPLDGRYHKDLQDLEAVFSESALISSRSYVEKKWLHFLLTDKALAELFGYRKVSKAFLDWLNLDYASSLSDLGSGFVAEVKKTEATTQHDVKAVEYVIRGFASKRFPEDAPVVTSLWHWGLTSEDVNNASYALLLRRFVTAYLTPQVTKIISDLTDLAHLSKSVPMMARTHGQSASPTTFGKEMAVFVDRLIFASKSLLVTGKDDDTSPFRAKWNGAVGNFNAFCVADDALPWDEISQRFVEKSLGLVYSPLSTQIETHDRLCSWLKSLELCGAILTDLCRDVWGYVSLGYLVQKKVEGEVGSSTMPHKINPIFFENAEGNFGLSLALVSHLSEVLLTSRWQRDLCDSTRMRSLGAGLGYFMQALRSLEKGLKRVSVDPARTSAELKERYEILSEAVQTVMRLEGHDAAYEWIKEKSRGHTWQESDYKKLLLALQQVQKLSDAQVEALCLLTPEGYIGLAVKLADVTIQKSQAFCKSLIKN